MVILLLKKQITQVFFFFKQRKQSKDCWSEKHEFPCLQGKSPPKRGRFSGQYTIYCYSPTEPLCTLTKDSWRHRMNVSSTRPSDWPSLQYVARCARLEFCCRSVCWVPSLQAALLDYICNVSLGQRHTNTTHYLTQEGGNRRNQNMCPYVSFVLNTKLRRVLLHIVRWTAINVKSNQMNYLSPYSKIKYWFISPLHSKVNDGWWAKEGWKQPTSDHGNIIINTSLDFS